jgi:hypothetical protein
LASELHSRNDVTVCLFDVGYCAARLCFFLAAVVHLEGRVGGVATENVFAVSVICPSFRLKNWAEYVRDLHAACACEIYKHFSYLCMIKLEIMAVHQSPFSRPFLF